MTLTAADVVDFWRNAGPSKWFAKDAAFDAAIREGFEALHHAAARGELDDWAGSAEGALALLLLLDQFPRNLYRGSAHAFATDPKARLIAREAARHGFAEQVEPALRQFFVLPFEHSEDIADQDVCLELAEAVDAETLKWARLHRDIIARFGRFPHRNAALGRRSTEPELAFIAGGGFSG